MKYIKAIKRSIFPGESQNALFGDSEIIDSYKFSYKVVELKILIINFLFKPFIGNDNGFK